jgi:methylenetetrahydrofolate dehydrogenase (NADP+)/methenyltetrahydrofolate cyclohydrolase
MPKSETDVLVLDGKTVSQAIQDKIKLEVETLNGQPGLAVILVGENPASRVYVNNKKKACERVGIRSIEHHLPDDIKQAELAELIEMLNQDDTVDGILLQLPLPGHLDSDALLHTINPAKDVDGFHPENMGKLLQGLDTFQSCTPYGVMEILKYYKINFEGKHVVIIGRSNIVGKPLAAMMLKANATVTVCHSRTTDLPSITRQADILVAAIGKPEFVTKDMLKDGAVVVDVGINRIDAPDSPKGTRLVGDVNYTESCQKASAITPVPGGVGPMTISMLLSNTLTSFKRKHK